MPLNFDDPSIVFEVTKGTILEASAGSGKTTILTERWIASFLYLLIWKKKTVSEALHAIVALTFTRKAATEMKLRIRARVNELWASDEIEIVLENITKYVGSYPDTLDNIKKYLVSQKDCVDDLLSGARISTINAYVLQLLKLHPLEVGIDIGMTADDSQNDVSVTEKEAQLQVLSKLLQEEYTDETIRQYFKVGVQLIGLTVWVKLLEQIRNLIFQYGEDAIISGLDQSTYLVFINDIKEIICSKDPHILLWNKISPSVQALILSMEHEDSYKPLLKNNRIFYNNLKELEPSSILQLFSKSLLGEYQLPKNLTSDDDLNKLREHSYYAYQSLIDNLYRMIIPIMLPISALCTHEYKKIQSNLNEISFGESEVLLLHVLKNSLLLKKIQSQVMFFFADEYQDTSDLQKSIFDLIISDNSVIPFFVGDPKQSIYSFRKANVYVFDQTIQEFCDRNYVHKLLNINYRSSNDLVDFVNYMFTHIFSQDQTGIQYHHQLAKKENEGQFYYTLVSQDQRKYSMQQHMEHSFYDALYVIEELLLKGVNPGDIMVLFRQRETILHFYQFLKKHQPELPLSSSVKNVLWNSEYITPILSFLRVLVNPYHDLTMIALLKTFLFCKTDEEINLLLLAAKSSQKSLYEVLDSEQKIIAEFLILKDRIPLTEFISLIIKEINYSEIIYALSETGDAAVTLSLFQEEVQKFQEKRSLSLGEFINYIDNKNYSVEEAEFSGEEGKTLQLMTIHASKGLESTYVLYVHKQTQSEKRSRFPMYQKNQIAFDILGKGILADNLHRYFLQEYTSEEKRLAYVAVTRAKHSFFFLGLPSVIKNEEWDTRFETQWASFFNQELVQSHPIFIHHQLKFEHIDRKHEDTLNKEDRTVYNERYYLLKEKEKEFCTRVLPQFLSVSLLLDIEFNPDTFHDKYLTHSFNVSESFREFGNENNVTLEKVPYDEIGALAHVLLQTFNQPAQTDALSFLQVHYPDKAEYFDLVLSYVFGYWNSLFYQNLMKSTIRTDKEQQVQCLLDQDIMIRATADLYVSSVNNQHTIVDYKLSLNPNNLERYHRQLSYYALLLEWVKQPVDQLVLFSLKEGKEYYLEWNRDVVEDKFNQVVAQAIQFLTSKEPSKILKKNKISILTQKDTLF